MKKIALAVVVLFASGCNAPAPPHAVPGSARVSVLPHAGAAQGFDYYLLNLSWSPEFCYSHPAAAECAQHASFVLHGLWPQRTDGSYPQDCSDAPGPADPSQYSDIYPDASLLEHEWKTHGTCTGLSPDAFFGAARKAFRSFVIPPKLAELTNQISLPPQQILSLVEQSNPGVPAESLAVSCGNNYLTAVEECLDTQLHPIACGPIRSCRANMLRIPPP